MGQKVSTNNSAPSSADGDTSMEVQTARSLLSREEIAWILDELETWKLRTLEPILYEEGNYPSLSSEVGTLLGGGTHDILNGLFGRGAGPSNDGGNDRGGGDDDDDYDPYAPPDSGPKPALIDPKFTLASVGGLEEQIGYLKRAVMYPLKHQQALKDWGVEPPKGMMFHGPPGTGKTLLAKALANEISAATGRKVSFFYHKGGESLSKWFGESSQNLTKLFQAAKAHKPAIIFLDEIDGLCPERERASQSTPAYATVVTTMLGLIDSVNRGDIFLIGATNRLDAVDPAIRRPGRFDKELTFSLPDEEARKRILRIHSSKWPRNRPEKELLVELAKRTVGYTGADLEKLCSDTLIAMIARCEVGTARNQVAITREDWMTALRQMTPSDTNVFGSSIFVSQPLIKELHPLTENIVDEILTKLRPQLPQSVALKTPYMGRKSFLVCDTKGTDFNAFTNLTLMRGLLSDPLLRSMETYLFDKDRALQLMERFSPLGALTHTVDQARNADKPAILFIPEIDWMEKQFLKPYGKLFHRTLSRIQGTDTILLGTYCGNLDELSPTLTDLFQGMNQTHYVRRSNEAERRGFFQQVFSTDLMDAAGNPPSKQPKKDGTQIKYDDVLETLFNQVLVLTEGDTLNHLTALYDILNDIKIRRFNPETDTREFKELSEELDEQIRNYACWKA